MWNNMMGWGWGGGGYFGLMHLAWWVLIIVGIVVLVRWLPGAGRGPSRADEDRSLIILRERYARGEIDKAEFEARKRDLG
jgi:putative membrane protein